MLTAAEISVDTTTLPSDESRRRDDVIVVTGSLDVQFADYDFDRPTSGAALSVEDHGVIELRLFFSQNAAR